jgi:sigma-B regulation protein RsbU (phosphoserine phosphatase)
VPGDTLLLYTDGLFEAANAEGAMYGEARLRRFFAQEFAAPGATLIDRLIGDIRVFAGRSEFEDDICALSVESTGNACALRPAPSFEI